MIRRAFVFAALFLVFGLACPPTWAQGSSSQPPIFTYVAEWNTPRAQWADMAKVEASTKPTMDALVADGTLLGYGTYENRIHSDFPFLIQANFRMAGNPRIRLFASTRGVTRLPSDLLS